jgi:hypothetical protein
VLEFEPTELTEVCVAQGLVEESQEQFKVRVVNIGTRDVCVSKGTRLGWVCRSASQVVVQALKATKGIMESCQ